MIRFEDDEDGLPQVAFTRGQKDLVKAGLDIGIESFNLRSTERRTIITMKTGPRGSDGNTLTVVGEWWGVGRFRSSYLYENDIASVRINTKSLSDAIEKMQAWASKKKRTKKTA